VVATDGVICFGGAGGISGTPVFALASATGRLLWHHELTPPQCAGSGVIVFSPAPGDDGQSTLWARQARTGQPVWKRTVPQGFGVMNTFDGVLWPEPLVTRSHHRGREGRCRSSTRLPSGSATNAIRTPASGDGPGGMTGRAPRATARS
jgi:outer membrane protein assembly factor BamB